MAVALTRVEAHEAVASTEPYAAAYVVAPNGTATVVTNTAHPQAAGIVAAFVAGCRASGVRFAHLPAV